MAAMAFPLTKHFQKIRLVPNFHLQELRARAKEATKVAAAPLKSPNGGGLGFRAPSRLYAVAVEETGINSGLCPESVSVTPIPVNGPTRGDAIAAIQNFRLNLTLNNSSSSSHQKFFFLESRPDGDGEQSYEDTTPKRAKIPDLNSSPPDVAEPVTAFVAEIKLHKISNFTEIVWLYLAEYGSDEEVAEYKKIMSSQTQAQIENLDSIRIWNILTLGDEIQRALVEKEVIENPIIFDDLPLPQQQLLAPPHGYKAATNHAAKSCFPFFNFLDLNETSSGDGNYVIPEGDETSKAKRKAVMADADIGDPCPYDHLQIKKPRHGGVLPIEELGVPLDEAEDTDSSDY